MLHSTYAAASMKKKSRDWGETRPPKSHHQSCWTREKSWHSDFGVGVFCIAEFLFFPPEISTTRNLWYFFMTFSDSSDSQSDGTNSGSEEKPSANQSSIKITNNGHAMKIIVEGGNFNNGSGSGSKSVDADVLLNTEKAKPALLPRPPPSLTTPSILKFRGKHLQSA